MSTSVSQAETWTGQDGGPTRNHTSTIFPSTDLGTAWTGVPKSGSIGENPLAPSCVLADEEQVYAVHRDIEDGSIGRLVALDRDTGTVAWTSADFAHASVDCPVLVGGTVAVATGFSPALGQTPGLRAFDTSDGAPTWSVPFTGGGAISSALGSDGTRVFASGNGFADCPDFNVHVAFDATTGARSWCVAGGGQAEAPPLVVGDTVLVGNRSDPGLTALDAASGATRWSDPQARGPYAVAAENAQVAYSMQDPVTGLWGVRLRDAATGSLAWQRLLPSGQASGAVVLDAGRVYVNATLVQGGHLRVRALHRATGADAWPASVSGEAAWSQHLYLLGSQVAAGSVLVDRASGVSTAGYHWGVMPQAPVFVDGTVFGWSSSQDGTSSVVAVRDITPPVLGPLGPGSDALTSDSTPELTFSSTDAGRGVSSMTLTLDGVGHLVTGSSSWSPITPLGDGDHTWSITSVDGAGNQTVSPERVLSVDATPPAPFELLAPIGEVTTGMPAVVWEPATDGTSGLDGYDVFVDGGLVATLGECAAGSCAIDVPAPLPDGSHTVEVVAVDSAGNRRSSGEAEFLVQAPPRAVLEASTLLSLTGDEVFFDASESTDNDGAVTYAWSVDAGPYVAGGATVQVSFPSVGDHVVAVRVTGAGGLTGVAEQHVEVRAHAPAGPVGVSLNGGAYATNDPRVRVSLVWRNFDQSIIVANDGGFGASGGASELGLAPSFPWVLQTEGPERLPRTVYVRLHGDQREDRDLTDDIIVDTVPPSVGSASLVTSARVVAAAATTVRVRFTASDKAAGIRGVQITSSKGDPGSLITFKRSRNVSTTVRARVARAGRVFVRVVDAAGNASPWRRAG